MSRSWKSARNKVAPLPDRPRRHLMPLMGNLVDTGALETSSHSFNYHFSSLSVVPTHHDFIVLF